MQRRVGLSVTAIVTTLVLGLAGCSSAEMNSASESGGELATSIEDAPEVNRNPDFEIPTVTGKWGEIPEIKPVNAKAPTEIVSKLITPGDGTEVAAGGMATIYYTGFLWDGKKFDSSFAHSETPTTLDLNRVIDGWKYGLAGSRVGDRVMLIIPPKYGYGSVEQGSIPADSTLIFVIDIVDVPGADLTALQEAELTKDELPEGLLISGSLGEAPGIGFEEGATAPTEQAEVTIAKGSGPAVTSEDQVIYHYSGAYWGTPNTVDTTWKTGPTVQAAQDTVFLGHNVGDRVLFVFPATADSELATVMIVDIVAAYK